LKTHNKSNLKIIVPQFQFTMTYKQTTKKSLHVYSNDETFIIPLPCEHNRCSSFTFTQVTQIEIFAQATYYRWQIF
jgi:hypothetical protein